MKRGIRFFALLGVLALAGCASIPSSGGVKEGEAITSNNQDFTLDYIPAGPAKNASRVAWTLSKITGFQSRP